MTENPIKVLAEKTELVSKPIKVMAVDDEEFNLEILIKHLKKAGYECIAVPNGVQAWEYLEKHPNDIDIILLDKMMPGMDGMEVLRKIKADPKHEQITVIMQTASVGTQELIEGIEAGAYYYLTKPYAAEVLMSIVDSAAREHSQVKQLRQDYYRKDLLCNITHGAVFSVRTIEEARSCAAFIANFYEEEPARVIVGVAALIINGIEHGNLGLGYERKNELVISGDWDAEVASRLALPENKNKYVYVTLERDGGKVRVKIQDQGQGFNWKSFIDFDPSRVTDPNGRGIAMANIMVPGKIEYQGTGSEVIYTIDPSIAEQEEASKEKREMSELSPVVDTNASTPESPIPAPEGMA